MTDPTRDQWAAYTGAFDYFNESLFDQRLPLCVLNFSRKSKKNYGFFAPKRWVEVAGKVTHEITFQELPGGRQE